LTGANQLMDNIRVNSFTAFSPALYDVEASTQQLY